MMMMMYFHVQVRGVEELETALCIRQVDKKTFRNYSVVASNHLRTSTSPVEVHSMRSEISYILMSAISEIFYLKFDSSFNTFQ